MQNVLAGILIIGMLLCALATCFPSYWEARTNGKTTLATGRMREYAIWRDRNPHPDDQYPPEKLVDPFTKKPFLLFESVKKDEQSSASWFLISAGPDKRYDCGTDGETFSLADFVRYDPTNGIHSPGDILIGSDISPVIR